MATFAEINDFFGFVLVWLKIGLIFAPSKKKGKDHTEIGSIFGFSGHNF